MQHVLLPLPPSVFPSQANLFAPSHVDPYLKQWWPWNNDQLSNARCAAAGQMAGRLTSHPVCEHAHQKCVSLQAQPTRMQPLRSSHQTAAHAHTVAGANNGSTRPFGLVYRFSSSATVHVLNRTFRIAQMLDQVLHILNAADSMCVGVGQHGSLVVH